jgi:hypothetical protein
MSILEEAEAITNGERQAHYGHPLHDYTKTVGAFNALTGRDLSPEEGCLFMVCVKLSRQTHMHKRDNLVDAAGYINCIDKIHTRKGEDESA